MPRKTKEEREQEKQTELEAVNACQERFVELILSGKSIAEAARLLRISRRTATYWMQEDSLVRFAYEHERLKLAQAFRERLTKLQDMALKALEDALDEAADPALRSTVARFIYNANVAHYSLMPLKSADIMVDEMLDAAASARSKAMFRSIDDVIIPDE
jgi:hypothetical protein